MKKIFLILVIAGWSIPVCIAQDLPPAAEQQLEKLTESTQAETEDDSYLQQLDQFRKDPIDMNTAGEAELIELGIISRVQIQNLLSYRRLLGKLVDIYELQAIPSWDLATIRRLLPFITISSPLSAKDDISHRFRGGDHVILIRVSQVLETSKGFAESKYPGSPQKIFFRYRYSYKNLLQFGILGDKDAGERFFKGAQNTGFDFYSFHLFARKLGIVQALAIGDFTVNLGQGLIEWQGLAFNKNAELTSIKRQSPTLRPYNSAGEFNFYRGLGISIKKRFFETTVFASLRKLNANLVDDTVSHEETISSFLTSGNNRTAAELADRHCLQQIAIGGNIKFSDDNWHTGVNAIYCHFSRTLGNSEDPYDFYGMSGKSWYNASVDYSYTFRNLHFFGEAAVDKDFHRAFINGLLVSVDPRVDISFLHRSINERYQALNGNAFTESSSPSNEKGFYAGISIRPAAAWQINAYSDIYKFPWLKYRVDAPSYGKDFLIQFTYTPNKQIEIHARYRNETKQLDQGSGITNYLARINRQNWRIQVNYKISRTLTLRNRVELTGFELEGHNSEKGFLSFFDFIYRPLLKPYSGILRLQYFETGGYDSRIYAYENDVLYGYSIPAFYDKGYRYYLTLNYDITKKFSAWLRWAQTIYRDKDRFGSGLDEIRGNRRSEIKLQLRYIL
ncbi:MAG TPA: helix-hairpin-helix domain-containing protein [Chitinophagaceae bacterium]|nr:helix-hairpin-helix domain-containing protein [Chitinophagaceae bacterium]